MRRWAAIGLLCVLVSGCGSSPSTGVIDFGTGYTKSLDITGKRASFRPGMRFAWVAHLSEDASAQKITVGFSRLLPGGAERSLYQFSAQVSDPSDNTFANKIPLSTLTGAGLTAPGTYVMRYIRGSTVLAKGEFRLQP